MEVYLLTPPEGPFLPDLPSLLEKGVDRLQYRRTALSDREQVRELEKVASLCIDCDVPLIVNDRPDLCLVTKADGVHLGMDDLPVEPVKKLWPDLIVGATQRVEDPPCTEADYLGVGPVFSSGTKSVHHDPSGWSEVKKFLDRTSQPVYAIGGITPKRLEGIPKGLAGICVIGSVWDCDDPVTGIQALQNRLPR